MTNDIMRPRVAADDDLEERFEQYVADQRVHRARAWNDLVKAGLEAEGY